MKRIEGESPVFFPQGVVLIDIAGEYKTVREVAFELIANEIDAGATTVFFVDNRKTRTIEVSGNGKGMTKGEFDYAFTRVRRTMKDNSKFGQHGLGFISALGKCDRAKYISRSRSQGGVYMQYTLETDAVRKQDRQVLVPNIARPDLCHKHSKEKPEGATEVSWYTMVRLEKYSKDPHIYGIKDAHSLAAEIEDRYGDGLRRLKAKVHILIINADGTEQKAQAIGRAYLGRKLNHVTIQKPHAGNVTFDLYLARRSPTGKQGKVKVGQTDNPYRLTFRDMVKTSPDLVDKEVAEGLLSGIFEGEILFEKAELLKNRKGFEEGSAFVEACEAINEWFEANGSQYLDEERELRNGERYQELGKSLLRNIEGMPALQDAIKLFKRGTVGSEHYDPDKFNPVGQQEHKSVSLDGVAESSGNGGGGGGGGGRPRDKPKNDIPEHHPLTAAGPRGHRRTIVRSGSTGFQILHDPMEGSERRWTLDSRNGILIFNVRHPDWVDLEGNTRKIRQYQELLAAHALVLFTLPDEWGKDGIELALEVIATQHIHQIKTSDAFNYRRTT